MCKNCREPFKAKDKRYNVFCSMSCAASYNNVLHPKRKQTRVVIDCLNCLVLPSNSGGKYCSRICYNEYRKKSRIGSWLSGDDASESNGSLCRWARDYLINEADFRCSSPDCAVPGGWSVPNPVTGKPILTIDHIDGNWKNNKRDNLIVLCYSCHTLTPTFGALNIGNSGGKRPGGHSSSLI